jgi:hypothetical protein
LFALLSPVSERPTHFYLGNKQYDPVKLGLSTEPLRGAKEFRTDQAGNSNSGHEFNDGPIGKGVIGRKLSDEERMEIIGVRQRNAPSASEARVMKWGNERTAHA